MSNKNLVINEKGDYSLQCGPSEVDGKPCYILLNVKTGINEVETKILPQAYKYLEELSAGLQAMIDLHNEDVSLDDKVRGLH